MYRKHLVVSFCIFIVALGAVSAQDAPKSAPNIDGTYRLVSRLNVADSTTVTPPDINGMTTFEKGYRHTIISWRDQNGLVFASSIIAKYKLTDSAYSETITYGSTHNEIGGQPVKYNFEGQSGSSPVKRDGLKITFKLPLGAPTLTFDNDILTSTVENSSVDKWERVK